MKLLTNERYHEYEEFLKNNKKGHFLQAPCWANVKDTQKSEILISEDANGKIKGSMLVLFRNVSKLPFTQMYSPRGPVCDIYDKDTISDLVLGAKELAKKYKSYVLRIDPDVPASDDTFRNILTQVGFKSIGKLNFEAFQPRYVFRINLEGLSEDEVFNNFHSKHRYNLRLAIKKGCVCKLGTREDLAAFLEIMKITGKRDGFNARPLSYFQKLYDEMEHLGYLRIYLIYYDNILVSGAIAILYGDKVWYLYGASSNEYRNVMPNYLMQWEMIKWAVENKCNVYDFRGVMGDDKGQQLEGLYRFKSGFNGDFIEFNAPVELILNNKIYNALDKAENLFKRAKSIIKNGKTQASEESEEA